MDQDKKDKIAIAVIIAAIVTVIFIVAVTVGADLYPKLKDGLKNTFAHHWIGKGILAAGLFALVSLFMYLTQKNSRPELEAPFLRTLSTIASLGAIVLFAFFVYEAFFK